MPHVAVTRLLQRFFPDLTDGDLPGATVRELIDELERRHPGIASYLVDETGKLRRHVNIFVGEEPIRDRAKLDEAVRPDDSVLIFQALSGG
jgi:molybdopterin synthase sulfur carrier subunit